MERRRIVPRSNAGKARGVGVSTLRRRLTLGRTFALLLVPCRRRFQVNRAFKLAWLASQSRGPHHDQRRARRRRRPRRRRGPALSATLFRRRTVLEGPKTLPWSSARFVTIGRAATRAMAESVITTRTEGRRPGLRASGQTLVRRLAGTLRGRSAPQGIDLGEARVTSLGDLAQAAGSESRPLPNMTAC